MRVQLNPVVASKMNAVKQMPFATRLNKQMMNAAAVHYEYASPIVQVLQSSSPGRVLMSLQGVDPIDFAQTLADALDVHAVKLLKQWLMTAAQESAENTHSKSDNHSRAPASRHIVACITALAKFLTIDELLTLTIREPHAVIACAAPLLQAYARSDLLDALAQLPLASTRSALGAVQLALALDGERQQISTRTGLKRAVQKLVARGGLRQLLIADALIVPGFVWRAVGRHAVQFKDVADDAVALLDRAIDAQSRGPLRKASAEKRRLQQTRQALEPFTTSHELLLQHLRAHLRC